MWCEVPITFTQAALGADVVVPTLDGKVSYTVREGTQPGDVSDSRARVFSDSAAEAEATSM